MGSCALAPVPRHPACRFGRGLLRDAARVGLRHCCCQWSLARIRCTISGFIRSQRARVGNVQSVQRGAAVKVGFPIKPPDYTQGETAARGAPQRCREPGLLDAPWGSRDIFSHEATFLSPGRSPGLAALNLSAKVCRLSFYTPFDPSSDECPDAFVIDV